jgi:hypothetical protein
MFCPNCGSKERQVSQFCRACGKDLRAVRASLEEPDAITASAVSARDEIGRAVAAKIRELKKASDLAKVTEEVLPQIEKFLEAPQERRLRRLRAGVLTTAIGLGVTLIFFFMSLDAKGWFSFIGLGLTTLLIGLGVILNALLFTVPNQPGADGSPEARRHRLLDQSPDSAVTGPGEFSSAEVLSPPPSVTEQTTQHLRAEPLGPSQIRDTH